MVYLWQRVEVRFRDIHLCQGIAVDGHSSLEDLIRTVAFVLQLLPRLVAEAPGWHTRHRQPPFVITAVEGRPK